MNDFPLLASASLPQPLATALAAIAPLHRFEGPDDAGLAGISGSVRGLVWTPFGGPLTGAFMKRFPKLELVATMGAGYEHIDVAYAAAHGVCVTNTPDAVTEDTADCAFALILDTVRRFPAAERYLRAGKWQPGKPFGTSVSLRNKRLGILGFGRIGKAVARRAEAFGLTVSYSGRRRQEGVAYPYFATAEELARNCDIFLSVLPGGDATRAQVGRPVFDALGSKGYFVNIGRGTSVDEPALIAALKEGRIAGAGLDVYAHEPSVPADLIAMENVVLLPHVGGATDHVMATVGVRLVENVRSFAAGKGPLDPVAETPWKG
ncbi:MAG TPA: 2-hydroxyacid dehydrogenase [Rhodoblastus sp.]|nr:2-hydroxyacid dehydrogenase [Rhodoblastus sp.]